MLAKGKAWVMMDISERNNRYKPMLDVNSQILKMKEKGITFSSKYNEEYARKYLLENNNFFRIYSYRKNFQKYSGKNNSNFGKYIELDFWHLRDLAILDFELRNLLLSMSLNVEHWAKLKMLNRMMDTGEDGFSLCKKFEDNLSEKEHKRFKNELERNFKNTSEYTKNIANKYTPSYPVWALFEMISFGRFISLYDFYAIQQDDRKMKNEVYLLKACKQIRNATAHNNCMLNDLRIATANFKPNLRMQKLLVEITDKDGERIFSKNIISKKLSNERILQISTLLYSHEMLVKSEGVRKKLHKKLLLLSQRINKSLNTGYYSKNKSLESNLIFLSKLLDMWSVN